MIEIKHKDTGEVLFTTKGDALKDEKLDGVKWSGANLVEMDLSHMELLRADL